MKKEFEHVAHSQLEHLNVLLVRMGERAVHIHRELELGLVLEGRVSVSVEQQRAELDRGGLYLVNPMEPHEFLAEGSGALILAIQLSPSLSGIMHPEGENMRFGAGLKLSESAGMDEEELGLLREICLLLAGQYLSRRDNYEFGCLALAALLLQRLAAKLGWAAAEGEELDSARRRGERLFEMTEYIERNFQRKLLLSEIAEREGLTLSYLSHFFKDSMGVTFQEYLSRCRFEHACRLLEKTDRSILDISLESGFSDVRYFNRMFLEHYGCPPGAFRARTEGRARDLSVGAGSEYIYPGQEALELIGTVAKDFLPPDGGFTLGKIFR